MTQITCETCGNNIYEIVCPHCSTSNKKEYYSKSLKKIIVVSLKKNRETVKEAILLAERNISDARIQGIKIIKFIHGYGSSGIGGTIKLAVRKKLKTIKDGKIIFGEHFNTNHKQAKNILNDFPFLRDDIDFGKNNKGITLFILK